MFPVRTFVLLWILKLFAIIKQLDIFQSQWTIFLRKNLPNNFFPKFFCAKYNKFSGKKFSKFLSLFSRPDAFDLATRRIFKSLALICALIICGWLLNALVRLLLPGWHLTPMHVQYLSIGLGCVTNMVMAANAPVLYVFRCHGILCADSITFLPKIFLLHFLNFFGIFYKIF